MHKRELIAVAFALMACLIWSGNFIIARGVHEWIPPITLAFWRWFIAFFVTLFFSYKIIKKEWSIICLHWKYLVIMGAFGVSTFNTLIYISAHYTTTHNIALISSTSPVITLLIAGIMRIERLSYYKIIGAICALSGALVVITHGNIYSLFLQEWNKGDLILVACSLIWATWNIAIRLKPEGLSIRSFLTMLMGIGSLALLPFYIWEANYIAPTPFTLQSWTIYLYISILASVIAWFLWQHSIETIGPVRTSLLYYSIPIFSAILAISILDEPLKIYHIIGFILVFSGVVISNLRKLRALRTQ